MALFRSWWIGLVSLLTLAGCSQTDLLDALIPHSGYIAHKDIAYGNQPRQTLDIYVPEHAAQPAPVVLFFYGGSWQKGSKSDYRFVGQALASRGYVTVIADYRLYPQVYFPVFVEDGARALVWVHRHIGEYGGDADNLFVSGHSAGAYIAAMLSINNRYVNAAGGRRDWIRGTIGIAGPYDFLPFTDPVIKTIFSHEKDALTQPISFVGPHLPPMLLLAGDKDEDVYPKNSIHLAEKLRRYHDEAVLKIYHDLAHIGIILAVAHGFEDKAPVVDDIDGFIQSHLKQ